MKEQPPTDALATDALAELRQQLAAVRTEVHALAARCAGLEEAQLHLRSALLAAGEVIRRA